MLAQGRGLAPKRGFELRARDGSGAALHHHDTARVVCQVRRLDPRRACCPCQRKDGDHGVTRAGDVDGLIRAVNRDVPRRFGIAFEDGQAVLAASDEDGLDAQIA